jgi:hypothetical protein
MLASRSQFVLSKSPNRSAIRGGATDHVKAELQDEIRQKAPMMKNLMAKVGGVSFFFFVVDPPPQ